MKRTPLQHARQHRRRCRRSSQMAGALATAAWALRRRKGEGRPRRKCLKAKTSEGSAHAGSVAKQSRTTGLGFIGDSRAVAMEHLDLPIWRPQVPLRIALAGRGALVFSGGLAFLRCGVFVRRRGTSFIDNVVFIRGRGAFVLQGRTLILCRGVLFVHRRRHPRSDRQRHRQWQGDDADHDARQDVAAQVPDGVAVAEGTAQGRRRLEEERGLVRRLIPSGHPGLKRSLRSSRRRAGPAPRQGDLHRLAARETARARPPCRGGVQRDKSRRAAGSGATIRIRFEPRGAHGLPALRAGGAAAEP